MTRRADGGELWVVLDEVRLTLLVTDEPGISGLEVARGACFWVEAAGRPVLFDAGRGGAAFRNADTLGIPIQTLEAVVLSHGHRGHTGGLAGLAARCPLHVVAHPEFDAPHWVRRDGVDVQVGVPAEVRAALESSRVERKREPTEIVPGVWTTGEIPRETEEDAGAVFFRDSATPDPFLDDQAMVIEHRAGLVVLLGCAHAGVVNSLRRVEALFPGRPLLALVGGMHLQHADPERLAWTNREILARAPRLVAPSHGLGASGQRWLEERLQGRYRHLAVGSVLAWDAGA